MRSAEILKMTNPMNNPQSPRPSKEVVALKDVTTSKYDAITASLESLKGVTERTAEASKGLIGAIEAMGDQIKASIEEMCKSVAETICRALTATMKEVLTWVLRNREQPAILALVAAPLMDEESRTAQATPTRRWRQRRWPRDVRSRRAREMATKEVTVGLDGRASAGSNGTPRSSTGPCVRVAEEGGKGVIGVPGPVFSGPGLLPVSTVQERDKAHGKKKMAGYEGESGPTGPGGGEPWPPGPGGVEPWPTGPGGGDEVSFSAQEGWWVDPEPDGA
ncbi:unnamed protein product [Linum trigynum]|uniref:Uncharacterized protein n=1 Tax=Linum trigynum TaxID=586398 RepID=A0AAV2E4C1_9ROSI